MATFKELEKIYFDMYGKQLARAALHRWVEKGEVKSVKIKYDEIDYDKQSFIDKITSQSYKNRAFRQNPEDYIGKTCGYLLIQGVVPPEERRDKDYHGTIMRCKCLACGKEDVQTRLSYVTGQGNYCQKSCGCEQKIQHFLTTTKRIPKPKKPKNKKTPKKNDFVDKYRFDFNRFLFVHKMLVNNDVKRYFQKCDQGEYENAVDHFFYDEQFLAVYDFWKEKTNNGEKTNTFYDWSKPSLDHILPKSRGGSCDISNLQVLTVFENLAKRDMTWEEWQDFKQTTHTQSDYFIENILKRYREKQDKDEKEGGKDDGN